METSTVTPDQRDRVERREFGWRTVVYGFVLSRRHAHRRQVDNDVIFLDWHHPWLFFLSVGTMLLSMRAVMQESTSLFVSAKLAMTALGIFVLVFLAKLHFLNRFRTGLFLTIFFSCYCCLVCYELVSLFRLG